MSFSWSYSAFSQALNCFHCFKKAYIDKVKPSGPESADLLFGSAMHSAWNGVITGQDGPALFDLYWESYANTEMKFSRFDYNQLREIGQTQLRKFIKAHMSRFNHIDSEKRLYGEYKGIKLEGTFDYYGMFDNKLCLLDLKTAAYNYDKAKQFQALQVYLYTYLALMNGYDTPKRIGYVVLNKGAASVQEPLVWDLNEDTMYKMLDEMMEYCKVFNTMIEAKTFPRNPNYKYHPYECYKETT